MVTFGVVATVVGVSGVGGGGGGAVGFIVGVLDTTLAVAARMFGVVGTDVLCLVTSFGRGTFGVCNASVRLLLAGG